jgi:hypothetical protein
MFIQTLLYFRPGKRRLETKNRRNWGKIAWLRDTASRSQAPLGNKLRGGSQLTTNGTIPQSRVRISPVESATRTAVDGPCHKTDDFAPSRAPFWA